MKKHITFYLLSIFFALIFIIKTSSYMAFANDSSKYGNCNRDELCKYELKSLDDFISFAKKTKKFNENEKLPTTLYSVKLIYVRTPSTQETPSTGRVYFFNTKTYQYHYDFSVAELNVRLGLETFNLNYEGSGEKRHFNMVTLVLNPETKQIFFELWNGDYLEYDYLRELFKQVSDKFSIADHQLIYHPLSPGQKSIVQNKSDFPIKTTDQKFMALNTGEAYGYLKFVRDEDSANPICLDHTSIAVFQIPPNDIGRLAGVISEGLQSQLSHISIKSMGRGTVNMSLQDAQKDLLEYENKPVHLTVENGQYEIELISENTADIEIKKFWSKKKPTEQPFPKANLDKKHKKFYRLDKIFKSLSREKHTSFSRIIGAKATNLAMMKTIANFNSNLFDNEIQVKTLNGYGIPFYYFNMFMNKKQAGLNPNKPEKETTPAKRIKKLLKNAGLLNTEKSVSICEAKPVLEKIRATIERAKVPKKLIKKLIKKILDDEDSPIYRDGSFSRLRFRSSTNSEDMKGFTGAGLYESKGVWLYHKKDDENKYLRDESDPYNEDKLEEKLREEIPKIYAGVWNDRAFEEREWYSINGKKHLEIMVGMALHRAFPKLEFDGSVGEVANGVAITTDIFVPSYMPPNTDRIFINSQHLDLSVTNPPAKEDYIKFPEDIQNELKEKRYQTESLMVDTTNNYWKLWTHEIRTRSSVKQSNLVFIDEAKEMDNLSQMEVRRLARGFKKFHQAFASRYEVQESEFALDLEWKIYGENNREIWVKQARPFERKK